MAEIEKITVKIGGMHCASCKNRIEKSLLGIQGISEASVNLMEQKAHLKYDPEKANLETIMKAVVFSGYQFLGIAEQEGTEEKTDDAGKKKKMILTGFIAGILLMILQYIPVIYPFRLDYILFVLSTPAFIYISLPMFKKAYSSLVNGNLDMDVMYATGTGVSYLSSVMSTFNILFTSEFMFYESAVFLPAMLQLGRFLEERAKGKSSEAVKKLLSLQEKTAVIIKDEKEIAVPVEELKINDLIVIKPGDRIPVDGGIVRGSGYVDQSTVTGEPMPVLKKAGDSVISGTISRNGAFIFRADKVGKDTTLSRIVELVEQAISSKPSIQTAADRAVTYFLPFVLTISAVSFFVWLIIPGSTVNFAVSRMVAVIVIACPCALGLAIPAAVTVGVGRGAELGIFVRDSETFQKASRITAMAFDKTGTLTNGKPEVVDVIAEGIDQNELIALTASAEKNSNHPVAEAIVRKAEEIGVKPEEAGDFKNFEGRGISAQVNGKSIFAGNRAFFEEKNILLSSFLAEKASVFEKQNKTAVLIHVSDQGSGVISIEDSLKDTAREAVEELKKMKIQPVMLTGDNEKTARRIAELTGIDQFMAEVLPEGKSAEIVKLQRNGGIVAFVGDGINDAAAMAQSDVGIAVGNATDIAKESGSVVLLRDDLLDAVRAIKLSKKVMKRIKGNLFWAFAYNAVLIPAAAGILYPLSGIAFRPELAGLAMALSSVSVLSLSLILKKYQP
jgi:Cu+-exporting ATPase